jgi:NAD(P)-dependent dehydrogenase (short-subunit alcohol dehydrogenase family)
MKDFTDKVAVITGAASGIGRALAEQCTHKGMKVVVADVDGDALTATEAALKATGAPVLAVVTDVSKAQDVDALAQRTLAASLNLLQSVGESPRPPLFQNRA